MKSSVVFALVLLMLVAAGHIIRLIFSVELSIAGDPVAVWWSVPAAILFGVAAFLLWRDSRATTSPTD